MAIRLLRKKGDELLQGRARKVTRFDDVLQRLVNDMFDTMYHNNGIGLAAPQIGIAKRILVADVDDQKFALVNPEVIWTEGEETDVEGCLSWPGNFGEVRRHLAIKVRAQNTSGEAVEVVADGLLARCLQHEIDHLNGVLFCDIASRMLDKDAYIGPNDD